MLVFRNSSSGWLKYDRNNTRFFLAIFMPSCFFNFAILCLFRSAELFGSDWDREDDSPPTTRGLSSVRATVSGRGLLLGGAVSPVQKAVNVVPDPRLTVPVSERSGNYYFGDRTLDLHVDFILSQDHRKGFDGFDCRQRECFPCLNRKTSAMPRARYRFSAQFALRQPSLGMRTDVFDGKEFTVHVEYGDVSVVDTHCTPNRNFRLFADSA
jgi:hypothetical protein